jgi:ABC-2 type transport system permease protein
MADSTRLTRRQWAAGTAVVTRRELAAYFDAPIAYVYASVFLILSTTVFMNEFFLDAVADMTPFFRWLPLLLVAFVPAITMRSWAEEHAQHTFELLLTLPLQPLQVVLGKFVAALAFLALTLVGTTPIVIMLLSLGRPDLGVIAASYLGALLLGALFLAVGLLASALTRDQVVAFVLAALLGVVLVASGHPRVVEVLDGLAPALQIGTGLRTSLAALPRYEALTTGLVRLADLVYFALMCILFLALNTVALQRSRY